MKSRHSTHMRSFTVHLMASLVCSIGASAALAWDPSDPLETLPADRTVSYQIRADPSDESSDVVFVTRLTLSAKEMDETSVAWSISEATFQELASDGSVVASWSKTNLELDTPDGWWWVEHADTLVPVAAEFHTLPTIDGTAGPVSGSMDSLDYALQAGTCDGTCQSMYDGRVASITHSFQETTDPEPIVEGDDEPAEVDDDIQ